MERMSVRKLLNVLLLLFCFSFTVMPVRICTAFAVQPVQLAAMADKVPLPTDVAGGTKKSKPKASAKGGEYEISVSRNDIQNSSGRSEDTASKVKRYINLPFKNICQYILLGILAWSLRLYRNKKRK